MNVIFLDVDGVLNSRADYYSSDLPTDAHFAYLQEIVEKSHAKIVLSSTWRINLRWGDSQAHKLTSRLAEFGLEIYDVTPELDGIRGEEIREYLDTHPDVDGYVVLDDDTDMLDLEEHLIHTDTRVGLQAGDVYRALAILLP